MIKEPKKIIRANKFNINREHMNEKMTIDNNAKEKPRQKRS